MLNETITAGVLPGDGMASLIAFAQRARASGGLTYPEFDAATQQGVNLFVLSENYDFQRLETNLDRILRDLPALKQIFARPIIRLKDSDAILPVESVRVINNQTVAHAAMHGELWQNITEEGELLPRKLLTLQNEDHYAIYENLAFARAVNLILQYVGRAMRALADLLYADRTLRFNLLERLNHPAYFLAIGKLHIGYVRDSDRYREIARRCLDKLLFIDRILRARLGSPVYQRCKGYKGALPLKKTNIFRMHKHYHRVYLLLKWFAEEQIGANEEDDRPSALGEGYGIYTAMLTLFAAGHFGYRFSPSEKIDFYDLRQSATAGNRRLTVRTVHCQGIAALQLTVSSAAVYRVLLLPATDSAIGAAVLDRFRQEVQAEEYLLLTPNAGKDGELLLSVHDIESFRRIQQILLRAAVYADGENGLTCPFCGDRLQTAHSDYASGKQGTAVRECSACRTLIRRRICPDTGREYTETDIRNFHPTRTTADSRKDSLLSARYAEAAYHFRNITPLDGEGKLCCPHCGQMH